MSPKFGHRNKSANFVLENLKLRCFRSPVWENAKKTRSPGLSESISEDNLIRQTMINMNLTLPLSIAVLLLYLSIFILL